VYKVPAQQDADALGSGKPHESNVCQNKVIWVKATGVSYYYDMADTLHWIQDSNSYYCLIDKGIAQSAVATQAQASLLGNGKPWQAECLSPGRVKNHIVRDQGSGTAYFVSSGGLWHLIPDAATYNCLISKGYEVIESNMGEMDSLLLLKKSTNMADLCPATSTITTPSGTTASTTTTTSPTTTPTTTTTSQCRTPEINSFAATSFRRDTGINPSGVEYDYWDAFFAVTFEAFGNPGNVSILTDLGGTPYVVQFVASTSSASGGIGWPTSQWASGTTHTASVTISTPCGEASRTTSFALPSQ
jgi:hypothetical protein